MGSCPELRAPCMAKPPASSHVHQVSAPAPHFEDFMEASSRRQGQSLARFPAPLPSGGCGVGAEAQRFLILAWSFC